MKATLPLSFPTVLLLAVVAAFSHSGQGQTTAFTFQGRLNNGGSHANGIYDLTFSVFTATSGGSPVAGPVTNSLAVSNGLFAVVLDFGAAAFPGADRWIEIGVRTNGVGGFSTLTPRQLVTSAPYALRAANV